MFLGHDFVGNIRLFKKSTIPFTGSKGFSCSHPRVVLIDDPMGEFDPQSSHDQFWLLRCRFDADGIGEIGLDTVFVKNIEDMAPVFLDVGERFFFAWISFHSGDFTDEQVIFN